MMNRQWVLRSRPSATLSPDNLELIEVPIPALGEGEVLVRNIYLSIDPTNRLWMSGRDQYMAPVGVGEVMRGSTIGVVEQSRSGKFAPGDFVRSFPGGWQLYNVSDETQTRPVVRADGVPLTAHMSVLGGTGITAYFGLLDVCRPVAGETLVVTAAAGAVGSIVGQIGRLKGTRSIGIAGGEAKCRWIVDELGYDAAIDYRSEEVGPALDRLCPDGVDMQFENVGGSIMDAVFSRLRKYGRMSLCGMISTYNDEGPMPGPTDFGRILMKRLTVRGFIVSDFASRAEQAVAELSRWVAEGEIRWRDHVVDGIEAAPSALELLFSGANEGKLLVRLSPEP